MTLSFCLFTYLGPVVQSDVPKEAEKRSNLIFFIFIIMLYSDIHYSIENWKCIHREILRILWLDGQQINNQISPKCKEIN